MLKGVKIYFSKLFLPIVGIIYLINAFNIGVIPEILALQPKAVLEHLNIWKIFTFPFSLGSVESILLFTFTFYFISPKLEKIVGSFRYPLWLFILTILQGCLLTLIFWNSTITISGMDGISFFILTLNILLKPNAQFNILRSKISIIPFTILAVVLWLAIKLIVSEFVVLESSLASLSSVIFGITLSILVYMQIRFARISENRIPKIDEKDLKNIPDREFFAAVKDKRNSGFLYNTEKMKYDDFGELSHSEKYYYISEDPSENEERLNNILDKMNSDGKESLTASERKFLFEYSKHI